MATYKANNAGMREVLGMTELYAGLAPYAAAIEARAKSNAPVESAESAADRGRTPGRFRDSIHTERHRGPVRVTMRVVADSDAAVIIERRSNALGRAAG